MSPTHTVMEESQQFIRRLHDLSLPATPAQSQLRKVALALGRLAQMPIWTDCGFRDAAAGQEQLHALALSPDNGPALYLISDGATVASPPHAHGTWAVIAGIRGCEVNHRYALQSAQARTVTRVSTQSVGPGDTLTLLPQDIHSTDVPLGCASFHLHLYGRALHALPPFTSRTYGVAGS